MLNMAVALSLRSTLLSVLPNHRSDASVLIKWPNDVVLWHAQTHRKCAGILVENVWRGSEWTHAVIGIGANVLIQLLSLWRPVVQIVRIACVVDVVHIIHST